MNAVIGANGFIGSLLVKSFDAIELTRDNLNLLDCNQYDTIFVAAPTGSRLSVNQHPHDDRQNCCEIIQALKKSNYNQIVHISTVDTYHDLSSDDDLPHRLAPHSTYGNNRYYFETNIANLDNSCAVRLPSLIHNNIKKNILFDLRHNQWLSKICLDSETQWYPLGRLHQDINWIIDNNVKYINLVSPPIPNRHIVQTFFPDLLEELEKNQLTPVKYSIHTRYDKSTYFVSEQDIWNSFTNYFKNCRCVSWKI